MRVYLTIQYFAMRILDFSCLKIVFDRGEKYFCKKVSIVMVNNSTVISNRTIHLPPQITEK